MCGLDPGVFKRVSGVLFVLWMRRICCLPGHSNKNGNPVSEQWLKGTAGEKMTRDLGKPVNAKAAASERTSNGLNGGSRTSFYEH